MKVALNLSFLAPGEIGGMETYARELAHSLSTRDDLELVLLGNRLLDDGWPDVERVALPVDPRRRIEWVLGDQRHVPRAASRVGADIVHSLASTGPASGRFVRVTTIHDLNYKLVPETHFGLRGLGMRVLVPLAARRSHRLLVDADSTRSDLTRHLGVPPDKVDVVPLAVRVPPDPPVTPEPELRERFGLGERAIVLSPSAKRPHKNIARLLRAVAAMAPDRRPAVVVPGYPTPHEDELRELATMLGIAHLVRLLPWVAAADLEGLHRASACVIFPSLYEGFGLPVLEAMARGVPVACSNRSSLPEVAGDAALLFDPEDVDAIRSATEELLADTALAARLRTAGRERAASFTWERTADLTVRSYRRALDSP
ncbi:MAG: glycosyltransferase family 4 protein [Thermoleophilaceae bacterium]